MGNKEEAVDNGSKGGNRGTDMCHSGSGITLNYIKFNIDKMENLHYVGCGAKKIESVSHI